MKLIIQIPCFNEQDQIAATLADLPRRVEGFDTVEWLVIDDGSTDDTVPMAKIAGVDHVISLPCHRGLPAAFQAGIDACIRLGADVIVNTDADNQYRADCIPALVHPILERQAEVVIGDRGIRDLEGFSRSKKVFQLLGSRVVRAASSADVKDVTSGFRAFGRPAALALSVVSSYTYTIESLIQVGRANVAVTSVQVASNPATRPSRLMTSSWEYTRRNTWGIIRAFAAYAPLRFFGGIASIMALAALAAFGPFLRDWAVNGDRSGHLQSILLGATFALASLQILVLGFVADLILASRREMQRVATHLKSIQCELTLPSDQYITSRSGSESVPAFR